MPSTLVIVRHGESTWNQANLFTGWHDVPLSPAGELEATAAGATLLDAGLWFDVVSHVPLTRATQTAERALAALGQPWLPVERSWRLNERHYGALRASTRRRRPSSTGRADQALAPVLTCPRRRSSRATPSTRHRSRYRWLAPDVLPGSECLKDVVVRACRIGTTSSSPSCAGWTVLVVAHGNSLRALVKHLEGIADDAIAELNIPPGPPPVRVRRHAERGRRHLPGGC
jgi:2,3-bisphosphoglycerate-dependent phosphoglycerate mutase